MGVCTGLDGFKSALGRVRTSTAAGGHRPAAWSLTAHSSGITTLPQILLNLGEEHFAGAGMGLAQAQDHHPQAADQAAKLPLCPTRLHRAQV